MANDASTKQNILADILPSFEYPNLCFSVASNNYKK